MEIMFYTECMLYLRLRQKRHYSLPDSTIYVRYGRDKTRRYCEPALMQYDDCISLLESTGVSPEAEVCDTMAKDAVTFGNIYRHAMSAKAGCQTFMMQD